MKKDPLAPTEAKKHLSSKGMIEREERLCYIWLRKHLPAGNGYAVDAGSFVGAPTICFAAGLAAADQRELNGRKINPSYECRHLHTCAIDQMHSDC